MFLSGCLHINSNAEYYESVIITDTVQVNGRLTVKGSVTVEKCLIVNGPLCANGSVRIKRNAYLEVNGPADVNGNIIIEAGANVQVNGPTSLDGRIIRNGMFSGNGRVRERNRLAVKHNNYNFHIHNQCEVNNKLSVHHHGLRLEEASGFTNNFPPSTQNHQPISQIKLKPVLDDQPQVRKSIDKSVNDSDDSVIGGREKIHPSAPVEDESGSIFLPD